MNKFLWKFLIIGSMNILSCKNDIGRNYIFLGKWKSLAVQSENKGLGFNITFEKNNSFHVEAFGNNLTETIIGGYKVSRDSFFVWDISDKPLVQCNYSDTGIYTFDKHGDSLFFKTIRDNCERRRLTLEIGIIKNK